MKQQGNEQKTGLYLVFEGEEFSRMQISRVGIGQISSQSWGLVRFFCLRIGGMSC